MTIHGTGSRAHPDTAPEAPRPGDPIPDLGAHETNPMLELLLAHRSVRAYRDAPLPERALDLILAAAQRAPTSSNLQSYSIVVVDDRELLERMCRLCGTQRFVAECSALLVFCSDISRHIHICAQRGYAYRGDQVNTASTVPLAIA